MSIIAYYRVNGEESVAQVKLTVMRPGIAMSVPPAGPSEVEFLRTQLVEILLGEYIDELDRIHRQFPLGEAEHHIARLRDKMLGAIEMRREEVSA